MKPQSFVRAMLGAVVAVAPPAAAADINADPSTYNSLLPSLTPGDTLHLAAGHYPLLSISNMNGAPSAWITITGAPGDPPPTIVDADPGPCCNTVEITNSSYVAIENLTIDGHAIDGAFGISAKGGANNLVHDIRIEGCSLINFAPGSQQHDGISTKTPTWGWIIRRNKVLGAGTGLYLGNSDGNDPFIGGLIEDNLIENPIGYCMEIKWQLPRPQVMGMPTNPTTTIIRNNVFIKNDDPSPDGDRPNLLVGGFPDTGPGASDRYEIYGNVFFHNPRESLFQGSGRVTLHDNVFVDAPGERAMLFRDHDLPLKLAYAYDNTIYGTAIGIDFGSAAPQGDAVAGNLVFAETPITGLIANQHDNLTDTVANAALYVKAPSTTLGQMDFYPLAGQCMAASTDESLVANDTDYALDFNCTPRGSFTYRGAYAGSGANPGWSLADGIEPSKACGQGSADGGVAVSPDGGGAMDDGGSAVVSPDGGGTMDGGGSTVVAPDGGGTADGSRGNKNSISGGCGCWQGPPEGDPRGGAASLGLMAIAVGLAVWRRAGERLR